MKIKTFAYLLALVLPAVAGESTPAKQLIKPWGVAVNPAGDCEFKAEGNKLKITVPGAAKPHDLCPELASTTAPRVVQPVAGDFVLQVKIDGEFLPGDKSAQPGRTGYTGAGLVVIADEQNLVRLERATIHREGGEPFQYVNCQIHVNGQPENIKNFEIDPGKPTWLRIARKGTELVGSISQDGEHWIDANPRQLVAEAWGKEEIVGGVVAVSTSLKPFLPIYSELSIQQGANRKAAAKKRK